MSLHFGREETPADRGRATAEREWADGMVYWVRAADGNYRFGSVEAARRPVADGPCIYLPSEEVDLAHKRRIDELSASEPRPDVPAASLAVSDRDLLTLLFSLRRSYKASSPSFTIDVGSTLSRLRSYHVRTPIHVVTVSWATGRPTTLGGDSFTWALGPDDSTLYLGAWTEGWLNAIYILRPQVVARVSFVCVRAPCRLNAPYRPHLEGDCP